MCRLLRSRSSVVALHFLILCVVAGSCGGGGRDGAVPPGDDVEICPGDAPVAGIVHVDAAAGDDACPGSLTQPLASIQAGIEQVAALFGTGEVRVAGGVYEINETITLVEGVSVLGGFAPDFLARDIAAHVTEIRDMRPVGAAAPDYLVAVQADATVTAATLVEGFSIVAGGADGSGRTAALYLDQGSPTLRRNTVHGGNGQSYFGAGDTVSISVAVYAYNASPTLLQNHIHGGLGDISTALFLVGGVPVVHNNTINGGDVTATFNTTGIYLDGANADLRNNTISGGNGRGGNAGTSGWAYGLYIRSSNPILQNNIVFTLGTGQENFCIYEFDGQPVPTAVANNDLFGCASALYADRTGAGGAQGCSAARNCYKTVADVNSNVSAAANNVGDNPLFVDPTNGDWRFRSDGSSPCSVTQGGANLAGTVDEDLEGASRGNPYSIGAYEHDGACT